MLLEIKQTAPLHNKTINQSVSQSLFSFVFYFTLYIIAIYFGCAPPQKAAISSKVILDAKIEPAMELFYSMRRKLLKCEPPRFDR